MLRVQEIMEQQQELEVIVQQEEQEALVLKHQETTVQMQAHILRIVNMQKEQKNHMTNRK